MTHGDDLYLIYTRRGANNDHVFRHRAPLFIVQVDTDRLCVIRSTERVLVPQRGARLGNFGVAYVNRDEVWVTVSEWMQTNPPDPYDCLACERYGSDNSIFLARIFFRLGPGGIHAPLPSHSADHHQPSPRAARTSVDVTAIKRHPPRSRL